jgi:hypothetical protein
VYLVVEERPNPSSDYFVMPFLARSGGNVRRVRLADPLPRPEALDGATLVFVRYVSRDWVRLVDAQRARIARLVFFMDDDLLDPLASRGLGWRYRLKLLRMATRYAAWLRRQQAELWVSSRYLEDKYKAWSPRLVLPTPIPAPASGCRVFYHGTDSHRREVAWLRPLMERVLAAESQIFFEIVGGRAVARRYRGLERVNLVHPMKWPAYQAFLGAERRDIGLVPQHAHPFNRARSYTKFFDITRSGAVGIYTASTACAEVVRDGIDGLVVAMDSDAWVDAILRLARQPELRSRMLEQARARVADLAEHPDEVANRDGV